MKARILFVLCVLVLAAMACQFGGQTIGGPSNGSDSPEPTAQATAEPTAEVQPTKWDPSMGAPQVDAVNSCTSGAVSYTTYVNGMPYMEYGCNEVVAYKSQAAQGQPVPTEPPAEAPAPTNAGEQISDPYDAFANGSLQTFSYVPGGEGFGKWATDVTHPAGYAQDECGRVWQATNLENLAWVTMFCKWQTSDPAPRLQWTHPTELTITDTGTVKFELWRDHGADSASNPSPYDVANQKQSPLGLGWFAQGFNAEICVNTVCQALNGGGVFQIGFPKDLQGHYDISITVNGGQAHFWQGEKVTSTDNWSLP